jgi:hypothetical protein
MPFIFTILAFLAQDRTVLVIKRPAGTVFHKKIFAWRETVSVTYKTFVNEMEGRNLSEVNGLILMNESVAHRIVITSIVVDLRNMGKFAYKI